MAGYVHQSPQGEETLYADGMTVSEVAKTRGHFLGRVPAFVGLAKANGGGVYAENLEEGMSVERALAAAGLDYKVVIGTTTGTAQLSEPLITPDGVTTSLTLEDTLHQSVIGIWPKTGIGKIFGQTSKRYQVVQPIECAELGETVLGLGHKLVAVGSYGVPLGSSMYLAFRIGDMTIGGEDRYDMYAHLLNSFHGHAGLHLAFAPIRFACTNETAMNFGKTSQRLTIKHMGDMPSKIEALKVSLNKTHTWADRFKVAAEKMLATPMSEREMHQFADKIMATPKDVTSKAGQEIWDARRFQLIQVALEAQHNEFGRNTRYGAYNALTSVLDHDMWLNPVHTSNGSRRPTARWERALDGGQETRLKVQAAKLLLSGV